MEAPTITLKTSSFLDAMELWSDEDLQTASRRDFAQLLCDACPECDGRRDRVVVSAKQSPTCRRLCNLAGDLQTQTQGAYTCKLSARLLAFRAWLDQASSKMTRVDGRLGETIRTQAYWEGQLANFESSKKESLNQMLDFIIQFANDLKAEIACKNGCVDAFSSNGRILATFLERRRKNLADFLLEKDRISTLLKNFKQEIHPRNGDIDLPQKNFDTETVRTAVKDLYKLEEKIEEWREDFDDWDTRKFSELYLKMNSITLKEMVFRKFEERIQKLEFSPRQDRCRPNVFNPEARPTRPFSENSPPVWPFGRPMNLLPTHLVESDAQLELGGPIQFVEDRLDSIGLARGSITNGTGFIVDLAGIFRGVHVVCRHIVIPVIA